MLETQELRCSAMIDRPLRRSASSWYVVHIRPRNEQRVARLLHERLGVDVYLPQLRRRKHGKVQLGLLFPCYLFVRADLRHTAISQINATPGVIKLVAFGGLATQLSDATVDELRHRVNQLSHHGGIADPRLYPGVAVRLRSGPLRGMEGAFIGPTSPSERVRVLLEFLGSPREAEVDACTVEPISGTPPPPPRERRTRGGGRRIAER
jgi:transcriptional antiterminator RfaH